MVTMDDLQTAQQINARLDRIPIWPYPWRLLFIIGIGFFFAFFDTVNISMALPVIQKQFDVTDVQSAWTITSGLIGYIFGSFIISRISDRYGRRIALYISIGLFAGGSLLSVTSPSLIWLVIWRLIIGMGVGAEISEVTTYMSEMSPASIRGKCTAITIAFGFLGFAVVPFVGLALVPQFSWGWRGLFFIGGIGALIICYMRRYLPKTPRWLIVCGRLREADAIVAQAETLARTRLNKDLPPVAEAPTASAVVPFKSHYLSELLRPPYLGRLLLFALIWCFYYIGNYAWLTLNATLFVDYGYNLTNSLTFVAINSIGFVVGSLLAIVLIDHFERKWFSAVILIVWTACLLVVGWFTSSDIILIIGFIAATTIGLVIPILYTYTGENFPTRIRATSVALTDGFGHIGGAFCGQIVFGVYDMFQLSGYGFQAAFTTMAVTGFFAANLLLFGIKMTKRSLSHVSQQHGLVED